MMRHSVNDNKCMALILDIYPIVLRVLNGTIGIQGASTMHGLLT